MNFVINKPLSGHDEDAPAFADDKILIVCDGLGGAGQNKYQLGDEKKSSAYLGSRVVSSTCQNFLHENYEEICIHMGKPEKYIISLKEHITNKLDKFVEENGLVNLIIGKSIQMLPTTLTAIVYAKFENRTEALVIWAGDSRAFLLTETRGLQQLTVDDTPYDTDAYEKSALMSNNIRQDGDFHLNYCYYDDLPSDCILFTCTDGCFDYLSTPMDLEYRVEYAVLKTEVLTRKDVTRFEETLGNVLTNYGQQDDCSMAGVIIVDEKKCSEMQMMLNRRALFVQDQYRNKYLLYDKKVVKRKAENTHKFQELDSCIAELDVPVYKELKSLVTRVYQIDTDITENIYDDEEIIIELRYALATLDVYRNYIKQVNVFKEKGLVRNTEISVGYDKLRKMYEELMFREYVNDLLGFSFSKFFNLNSQRNKLAQKYSELVTEYEQVKIDYSKNLQHSMFSMQQLGKKNPENIQNIEEQSQSFLKFEEKFSDLVDIKTQLQETEDALRLHFREKNKDIESKFKQALSKGFVKTDPKDNKYKDICKEYDKYVSLQTRMEEYFALSKEDRLSNFERYLEENWPEIRRFLQTKGVSNQFACKDYLDIIQEHEKKRDELTYQIEKYEVRKYDLWKEYKPLYELYNGYYIAKT